MPAPVRRAVSEVFFAMLSRDPPTLLKRLSDQA
jgi:hypothetical protein